MSTHDVIVAGAGIGGASAALFLEQAGLSVLVLEKEALPHAKVCAGGLPISVLNQFPFPPEEVVQEEIRRVRFVQAEREATFDLPPGGIFTVRRERLDARVLQASGAEVRDRCAISDVVERADGVTLSGTLGEEWTARYLVGADGFGSSVARLLRMKRGRELVPAVEAEVPADRLPERYRGVAEFAFGRLYGYIWVFAKGDRASVGAGIFRRERIDLRGILSAEMARRGINLDGIPIRAHPLPVYRKASPLHSLRTVLVGDAAGLVDPLQGEGIRHAVTSARIAASVIAAGRPLAEYTRKVQELIGRSHTRAGQLSWILYHFPGLAWRLALQSPRSVRVMTDLFNDKVDYPGLSRRLPSIALQALFGPITRTSRPQKEPG